MTRKERLLAAIRLRPVDRIPYATYNLHPYGAPNQHTDDPTYAELLERVRDQAGAMIKFYVEGVGPGLSRADDNLCEVRMEGSGDERARTTIVHTPQGDLTCVARIPEHKPGMVVKPFISSDEEVARYMSIPYEAPRFNAGNIRSLYESIGDRAALMVAYSEPMYAVASLFDFEDFTIRCITDLDALVRFIEWAYERSHENLRLLLEACKGMELIFHTSGPEVCCPPMLSPGIFAKLVTPYTAKLITLIHDYRQLAGIHCHGRVREVFPEMVRTGTDMLEPIEPPPQGNIGLAELMEQAGGRLCLMGHIQDQELYTAKPGETRAKVREIARIVNGRTGYIMSPTCTPFEHPCSETYRRNYLEWLDAAEELPA